MNKSTNVGKELEDTLRLRTKIIAYRKLEQAEDLNKIPGVHRVDHFFTFCQAPFMVRVKGLTIGITKDDKINARCSRLCGLREATEKSMSAEANLLATTWFRSPEEALKQQSEYPRIPVGGAIVLAPLTDEKFDPEVVLVYGNPAQIMMLMCGLQKVRYEHFWFSFIGEGACADSLAQCYVTGKPALSIGCYGERALGHLADDEILIALPSSELERAVSGLRELGKIDLKYPIRFVGPELDPTLWLAELYPQAFGR